MTAIARRTYLIGSFGFIAIGLLHSATHFLELSGADLESRFEALGSIDVSAQTVASWDLFQGTSLLMGLFSVAIGLGAIGALKAVGPMANPPIGTSVVNIAALVGVMVIGKAYLGPLQIWGGLFGVLMFAPSLVVWMQRR
ncbi:MAG: hypothetical protein V3V01_11380 [Acidimicrobiales bacterium]